MQISTQVDWFDAIRNQDYEAIYDADGVFHGSRDAAGETGLMKAAKFNDIKLAKMLAPVEAGIVNNEGHNALMIAALNNNSEICFFLVEIPSECDHRLGYGEDALILAASVGALKSVAVLLPHMEKTKDLKGRTCLTYAACNGKLNVVNYLIRYKQEITDMEAKAALVAAAGNSHADCVHALTIYIRDGKINYLATVPTEEDDMDRDYYRYDDILPQTDLGLQGLQDSNIYNVRPAELHLTQRPALSSSSAPASSEAPVAPHQETLEFVPEPGVVDALQVSGYVEPSLDLSPNVSIINRRSPGKGKDKDKGSAVTLREKRPKTPTIKSATAKVSKARTPTTALKVDNTNLTSTAETRNMASERTLTSSTLLSNTYNTSNLNRNLNRSLVQSNLQATSPRRSNYVTPGQASMVGTSAQQRNISPTASRSSYVDNAQYSLYEAIEKASKKKLITPPQDTHPRSLDADILTKDPQLQEAMVARYYEDVSPPPRQPGASASTMAALNKSNIKAIRSNTNNRFAEVNPLSGTFYGPSTTAENFNPTESSLTASILHPVSSRDVNLVTKSRTLSRSKSGSRNPRARSNALPQEDFSVDQIESPSRLQTPTMSMRSSTIRLKEEVDLRPTYVDLRASTSADRYEDTLCLNPSQTAMPIGPLSRHIQRNDITILEIPNFEADPSYTDLMQGIYNGDKKLIKQNMKTQANLCSDTHMTALMVAARIGDIANAKLLIKAGETGRKTNEGWTALMIAAFHNSVEAVRLLMDHEARSVTNDGWTALMIAIKFNAIGCVELLAGCEAGIQDRSKVSAMMIAAYMGRPGIIPLLIKEEAKLCDSYGRTAMMYATLNNEVECVEKLVYAESNVQDPEGRTALMMAAQLGLNDIVLVLQKEEAGKRANMGRTALMFAARNCNLIGVQVLAGTECGLQDAEGWSAMMMAVLDNQAEIVKSLKDYEANLKTNKGFTALMFAARFGFDECVEILAPVEAGEQTPSGWSALMAAVSNNNLTSARLLVPYEVMLQDAKRNTALMLACKKNNNEMIKLLRQAQEAVRSVRNNSRR